MARAEKPTLLRWLYRSECDEIFPLRKMLERGALAALEKDTMSAEAYAESNLSTFWNYLLKQQETDKQHGLSPVFEIEDLGAYTLRWCPPPVRADCRSIRRNVRLRHRPAMLRMIDSLNDREYEALACVALRAVGASDVCLTPAGNEGGVDFFGLLPSPGSCHLFSGGHHPLRIIGQSKKYTHPMEAGEFKEFLTTMDEVKHGGQDKTEKIVPPWFRATYGPIIGLVFAHSGFQSGAESRGRRHGVITATSVDIAEMLALSREVPEETDAEGRAACCRKRVGDLLK